LSVPVKYIGVGESIDDLERFRPEDFLQALFADWGLSDGKKQSEEIEVSTEEV
jgi:fused signal recognition particle receptor